MDRLNEILKNNHSSCILFPDSNDVEDDIDKDDKDNNTKDNNKDNKDTNDNNKDNKKDYKNINNDNKKDNNKDNKKILSVEELFNKNKTNTFKSYESNKLNIIVPDGSWECAKAIVREIRKEVTSIQTPCVSLDMDIVSLHHSSLIEALKLGQGLGRISTLEAIAIFKKQSGNIINYNDLINCLQPLVNYININFNSSNNTIINDNNRFDNNVKEIKNKCLSMMLNDLKDIPIIPIPYGLRR
jgi:hypothetical protein